MNISTNISSEILSILTCTRKINLISTFILVIIGLIGHFIVIFVFGQKRFRTNSSNVFLLCMAINDACFLIVHFFEHSVRNYKDIYLYDSTKLSLFDIFIIHINITDRFESFCRLISYLRYALRFISSYLLVAFTIQRLTLVYSPLNGSISKSLAWQIVLLITIASFLLNIWPLFLFEIQHNEKLCDIKTDWSNEYFQVTSLYILFTIFIPIFIILLSNIVIITNLFHAETNHHSLKQTKLVRSKGTSTNNNLPVPLTERTMRTKMKPHYLSISQLANKPKVKSIKNSTRILLLISFIFIILNFPYLITW